MAKFKIIWSFNAENELFETLEYYIERNKSNTYSKKLHSKIKSVLSKLTKQPLLGRPINSENNRGIYIGDYLIVYEFTENVIEVLLFWDCRRDPETLENKLDNFRQAKD